MTKQSIASLAIKLMAVYVLIWTFPSLISLGAAFGQFNEVYSPFSILITIALLTFFLVTFIWFIRKADWFAQKIVPDDESTEALSQLSTSEVQAIAFSCIGLLILSRSLPALVQQITYIGATKFAAGPEVKLKMFASSFSQIMSILVQLAIGFYLFLSPRGLVKLWNRLQETRPMKAANPKMKADD